MTLFGAALDLTPLIPVIIAIIGGGGIAWYTAKPKREGMIAEASERAVAVVKDAIERLEHELYESRQRMAILEEQLRHAKEERDKIEGELRELRLHMTGLREQLIKLGYDPGSTSTTPSFQPPWVKPPELPGGQGDQ